MEIRNTLSNYFTLYRKKMKRLILIRHAKSSWELDITHIYRPLSPRGIEDANLLSKELLNYKIQPNAIFSSPANRALHTAMIFCRQLYFPLERFQVTAELYDFSGNDVLGFIKNLGSDLNTVMVFGHNHAFTYIANSLGNTYIDNVPTSGLVHLQFQVDDWSSVAKGTTKQTIFPKEIRG